MPTGRVREEIATQRQTRKGVEPWGPQDNPSGAAPSGVNREMRRRLAKGDSKIRKVELDAGSDIPEE